MEDLFDQSMTMIEDKWSAQVWYVLISNLSTFKCLMRI